MDLLHHIFARFKFPKIVSFFIVSAGIVLISIIGFSLYLTIYSSDRIVQPSYKGPVPDGALTRLGKGGISVIAVSPDGNYLAVGNQLGVYVYNANSFEQLWVNPCGNVRFLEFSPDSRSLISISDWEHETYYRAINEWEASTGNIIRVLKVFTEFNMFDIVWKSNQNPVLVIERHHIVGQSKDGLYLSQWSIHFVDILTARIWQAFTAQSYIDSFAASPDGTLVAYNMSSDQSIRIWSVQTGKETINIHFPNYAKLKFSSNGKFLLASAPNSIYLFDPITGRNVGQTDHSRSCIDPIANQDGNKFLELFENKIVVRSLPDMVELRNWATDSVPVNGVWGKNASTVFIQTIDGKVEVWDISNPRLLQTLEGHLENSSHLAWSRDSKMIITVTTYRYGDRTSSLLVWNLEGNLLRRIAYPGAIGVVAWSPDNEKIAITNSGKLVFLDIENFAAIKSIELDSVQDLDWSPDGKKLAVASGDRRVSVFDYAESKMLFSISTMPEWLASPEFPSNPVISIAWSPDGTRIAGGMWDGPAYIWDANTGKELLKLDHTYTAYSYMNSVIDINWSPDGDFLAGGFNSGIIPRMNENGTTYFLPGEAVATWNVHTGQRYSMLKANYAEVNSIDWSPNSELLAISLLNKQASNLYVWNTNDPSEFIASELPELKLPSSAYEVRWSPDGKMLAAVLEDGTIAVWDFEK